MVSMVSMVTGWSKGWPMSIPQPLREASPASPGSPKGTKGTKDLAFRTGIELSTVEKWLE